MHLEQWQNQWQNQWQKVDRLLLCGADLEATEALLPALELLRDVLPEAEMMLLVSAACDFSTAQLIPVVPVQTWIDRKQIEWLRQQCFDAAIIFTEPFRSPYAIAYLCYLAGIPIRIGQSQEFGGAVLSICVTPPPEPVCPEAYHLHLLQSSVLIHAVPPIQVSLQLTP